MTALDPDNLARRFTCGWIAREWNNFASRRLGHCFNTRRTHRRLIKKTVGYRVAALVTCGFDFRKSLCYHGGRFWPFLWLFSHESMHQCRERYRRCRRFRQQRFRLFGAEPHQDRHRAAPVEGQ